MKHIFTTVLFLMTVQSFAASKTSTCLPANEKSLLKKIVLVKGEKDFQATISPKSGSEESFLLVKQSTFNGVTLFEVQSEGEGVAIFTESSAKFPTNILNIMTKDFSQFETFFCSK